MNVYKWYIFLILAYNTTCLPMAWESLSECTNNPAYLMSAIKTKDIQKAKKLIEKGADVNIAPESGSTPLISAIIADNKNIAFYLLNLDNIDVNLPETSTQTPLMWAVKTKNNEKVIRGLLEKGADINQRDNLGKTALIYAISEEDEDKSEVLSQDQKLRYIKILIEEGNSIVEDVKYNNKNALQLAREEGESAEMDKIISYLEDHTLEPSLEAPLEKLFRWAS